MQEGSGPALQICPEQQFGKSNTQETRSSKVLKGEGVGVGGSSYPCFDTRVAGKGERTLTSCPENHVAQGIYDAHFTEEIKGPGAQILRDHKTSMASPLPYLAPGLCARSCSGHRWGHDDSDPALRKPAARHLTEGRAPGSPRGWGCLEVCRQEERSLHGGVGLDGGSDPQIEETANKLGHGAFPGRASALRD